MKQEINYSLTKDADGYLDERGVFWDSPTQWFWGGVMGACGCGSDLGERAVKVLNLFAEDHMKRTWSVYDDEADEILAQWMDSKGLLEHGSSVAGSWLSEKGEAVYKILESLK